MQSYKIVFVARACNIQCILHQSCPMKIQNFAPMRYPVIRIQCAQWGTSAQLWAVQHFLLGRATLVFVAYLLRQLRGIKHRLP